MADFTPNPASADSAQERVQELTWALVDQQITDDEMSLLDNLLLSDDKACATYVDCIQLHADLATHFAAQRQPEDALRAKSPVLGFLNAVMPPMGLQSNTAQDSNP